MVFLGEDGVVGLEPVFGEHGFISGRCEAWSVDCMYAEGYEWLTLCLVCLVKL